MTMIIEISHDKSNDHRVHNQCKTFNFVITILWYVFIYEQFNDPH